MAAVFANECDGASCDATAITTAARDEAMVKNRAAVQRIIEMACTYFDFSPETSAAELSVHGHG
jgi:hypothetical protein